MKRKLLLIVIISLLGILLVMIGIFTFLATSSPGRFAKEVYQQFEKQGEDVDTTLAQTDLRLAFLKARINMALSDSVCASINLKDSLLLLEIKGVEVYRVKIKSFSISPVFNMLRPDIITHWTENPFTVEKWLSTIPRQFILKKNAPGDTATSASTLHLPDTVQRESVCYQLYLDRGVRLQVFESKPPKDDAYKTFFKVIRNEKTHSLLDSLVHFKVPQYHPWITIEISGRNAKTILRSLPEHAKVAILL